MSDAGWEWLHRAGEVVVLGGFAVDLILRILQIRGVISLAPDRETLIAGGIVAALAGLVMGANGLRKFYDSNAAIREYHPAMDLVASLTLIVLAVTCLISAPPSAHASHPASHSASASSGSAVGGH